MCRVVLPDEVHYDCAGLPDCEVVVRMVDDCWQTPVRVLVGVGRLLVVHCTTKD